jgi:hypothetical protein
VPVVRGLQRYDSCESVAVPFQNTNQLVSFLSGKGEYNYDLHAAIVNGEVEAGVKVAKRKLDETMIEVAIHPLQKVNMKKASVAVPDVPTYPAVCEAFFDQTSVASETHIVTEEFKSTLSAEQLKKLKPKQLEEVITTAFGGWREDRREVKPKSFSGHLTVRKELVNVASVRSFLQRTAASSSGGSTLV